MKHAPDFRSHEEHDKWVIENADYFTAIRPAYRAKARFEFESLEEARVMAFEIVAQAPEATVLIYAVCGVYSAYVEAIRKEADKWQKE